MAKIEDLPQMLDVERATWGKEGATEEMIKSRIETFSDGILVALMDNKIVGTLMTQIINADDIGLKTWYGITDDGFIKKTHTPKGDTLYGVSLSVHPLYRQIGISRKIFENIVKLIVKYNLKQVMLGGRVPDYYKFADKIKIEDYIKIEEDNGNIPPDSELTFYRKFGLDIVKIIPNYFKDPESLNYGILLRRKNPCFNKFYRWFILINQNWILNIWYD